MSPNFCVFLILLAGIALLVVAFSAAADHDRPWHFLATGLVALVLVLPAMFALRDLQWFALGNAHYEQKDNADGTRTWHRVDTKEVK